MELGKRLDKTELNSYLVGVLGFSRLRFWRIYYNKTSSKTLVCFSISYKSKIKTKATQNPSRMGNLDPNDTRIQS